MTSKCWRFKGEDYAGINTFEFFVCGTTPSFSDTTYEGYPLRMIYIDGSPAQPYPYGYQPGTESVVEVSEVIRTTQYSGGDCTGCIAISVAHDCINGACTPKTTYNTPGLYQSLEECEVNCGTGCSGKCISNAEWSQIESLSNQLKSKTCGG